MLTATMKSDPQIQSDVLEGFGGLRMFRKPKSACRCTKALSR